MEEKPRTTPYPLRMPDELRAQLEEAAKAGSRSLHAEIVLRLQSTFGSLQGTLPSFQMTGQMAPVELQSAGRASELRAGEALVTAGQAEEIARRAGEVAAREVLRAHAQSLQPAHFGGGRVLQGPPPEAEAKPKVEIIGKRTIMKHMTSKKPKT